MKKIVILSLLATLVFAQNPKVYSAIGDTVYNDLKSIEKLRDLTFYDANTAKINRYVRDAKKLKKDGFKILSGDKSISRDRYLAKLRLLHVDNKEFKRKVKDNFTKALANKNSILFSEMLNSGLLNTTNNKKKILDYYENHKNEIMISDTLQSLLDQKYVAAKKRAKWNLSKKQIKDANIKRLREQDKAKKDAIQKSLEEELIKKKRDIRANQKRELSGN